MAAAKPAADSKSTEPTIAEIERRTYRGDVTARAADGDGLSKLDGYAAVFNQETVIGSAVWGFREQVAPGAFAATIVEDDICGLFNHDDNQVLGRTKSGTLKLSEDKAGLRYVIDPPDTVLGRDLLTLVARGDINGSSFAFQVVEDKWEYPDIKANANTLPLRTLLKVRLFDVSPVTYPAYPQTSVSARAKEKAMATAAQKTETPARGDAGGGRRDGNGAAGAGDTGDVGGDAGGMAATKAAIQQTMRQLKKVRKATRGMIKALDISHGFNDGPSTGAGLAGAGGPAATGSGGGTPRKKLTKAEQKALRHRMRALYRDKTVDADSGSGSISREVASATMYYAGRGLRDALTAANRNMRIIRAMCRATGLDLSKLPDPPGPGSQRDGTDGTVVGADAGGAGANAAALQDLDLRAHELEIERLR